jgi:hypothetical protein
MILWLELLTSSLMVPIPDISSPLSKTSAPSSYPPPPPLKIYTPLLHGPYLPLNTINAQWSPFDK